MANERFSAVGINIQEKATMIWNEADLLLSGADIAAKLQLLTQLDAYKKSVIYEYVTGKREVSA
ncbi:MAG: hypothetical protein IKE24_12530 [Clostridia bacterium]|nr:hypothetical protein [Clostridia bacterium]